MSQKINFTPEQIQDIKYRKNELNHTYKEIAEVYNVGITKIHRIITDNDSYPKKENSIKSEVIDPNAKILQDCFCTKCRKVHKMKINWKGVGTPNKLCRNCR